MPLFIVEFAANNEVQFKKTGVVIGSRFTVPCGFADTKSGTYWHVLPQLDNHERAFQAVMLEAPLQGNKHTIPKKYQDGFHIHPDHI